MARRGKGTSASSLGVTQILEVMTKLLSVTTLSPLGADLTSLMLIAKYKRNEDEDVVKVPFHKGSLLAKCVENTQEGLSFDISDRIHLRDAFHRRGRRNSKLKKRWWIWEEIPNREVRKGYITEICGKSSKHPWPMLCYCITMLPPPEEHLRICRCSFEWKYLRPQRCSLGSEMDRGRGWCLR